MADPSPDSILLLSSDHSLIEGVRSLIAPTSVQPFGCLRELPASTGHHRIILDPRQFSQCCLKSVVRLGKRFSQATLRTLSYPTLQATLFEITENEPAPRARQRHTTRRSCAASRSMQPRQAWRERETIFSVDRQIGVVRRFLELALAHSLESYSVAKAAAGLHSSARQLDRYCLRSLGYSPGLLIDLTRIMSVVEDLFGTEWRLEIIAFMHGFHDAATMSRQFLRFTGERPGAYRVRHARSSGIIRGPWGRNCH